MLKYGIMPDRHHIISDKFIDLMHVLTGSKAHRLYSVPLVFPPCKVNRSPGFDQYQVISDAAPDSREKRWCFLRNDLLITTFSMKCFRRVGWGMLRPETKKQVIEYNSGWTCGAWAHDIPPVGWSSYISIWSAFDGRLRIPENKTPPWGLRRQSQTA